MPYATDRDRNPHLLELEKAPWPVPPLNLFLTSGYQAGVYDLCWDDPASMANNSRFSIVGVNLYRSFDSEFGPFERITDLPVGSVFWRDQTLNAIEVGELVEDSKWVVRGSESAGVFNRRYIFQTVRCPLVRAGSQNVLADNATDVVVTINGEVAPVLFVDGESGEIEVDLTAYPNVATQLLDPVTLPEAGSGVEVRVTYRYNQNFVKTDLMQRVFYRVTTVGIPVFKPIEECSPQDLVETPLERAAATSNYEIEKLDWIWTESVRRNRWILDQGGERVKVLLRKHVGQPCPCVVASHGQALNDCTLCFGTRILGGYEGPYDIVIAPDDAERRITQSMNGRTVEHTYEVWTGPSPLLSQRDLIVKVNGDRYSIGPVRMPTNRGMVLQQHFNIGHLDEKDIRYSVPIDNPLGFVMNQLGAVVPPQHFPAAKTDKPNIPNEREIRGRTAAWENIVYAVPLLWAARTLLESVLGVVT